MRCFSLLKSAKLVMHYQDLILDRFQTLFEDKDKLKILKRKHSV